MSIGNEYEGKTLLRRGSEIGGGGNVKNLKRIYEFCQRWGLGMRQRRL